MTTAGWIFAPAAMMLAAFAAAQSPAAVQPINLFDLGAPTLTNFSARDGVHDSVIVSVQTDHDGFVWLASAQELARYDGRSWHTGAPLATTGSIGYLLTDHDGTLWSSFRDRGIARFDGAEWHFEQKSTDAAHVRRLAETVDGAGRYELWAPTFDRGLLRYDHDRWTPAPNNSQLPRGVLSVARTRTLGGNERLWAGTFNEGLWYREDGNWQRLRTHDFDPSQIEHLLVTVHAGREELWVTAFGNGLWRLDDSGWHSWNVAKGDLPTNELYDIAQSRLPNGGQAIWVASRSGLIRVHNDQAQYFDRRHGLPSNVIRGLSVWRSPDGIDVLWLATENGVSRTVIGANQWQTASLMGASSVGVFGLLIEPDDNGGERLWVAASADGLGLYEHGRWQRFSDADGVLPDSEVRMIKRMAGADGTSELWLGQRYGHLLRVRDGPRFEPVETPWERHPGQAVMDALARNYDGHYERWFATRQSGVYRWRDGAWTGYRPDAVAGQWRTVKLLDQTDDAGRAWLWATSNQGLARFDGERWALFGRPIGLPDVELIGATLMPDAQGRAILWIGSTNSGVIRVDVSDPRLPRVVTEPLPRPPDPTAYSALRDSQGRVYICTNAGVQVLTPAPGGGFASRIFTRSDGMVHEECNTNAQLIDAHDRFWTGTLGGVTVFDPHVAVSDRQPKPLRLTDLRIDGAAVGETGARMLPGNRELRIEFALLSWQRETETRFRTQLIGYENEPGAWTKQNYRSFNALPAGNYTLRIEGRDYAGNFSTPLDVAVEIVPGWWQRSWSEAAFMLATLLTAYALVRWRTRSIRMRQRRLEEQVADRTAELNAANVRLRELSYKDALTGLANRRSLLESLAQAWADGSAAVLIFVDVDHFKDYNDRYGHPAGDAALCAVANAMCACAPPDAVVARYGGEEFACLLLDVDLAVARELAERIRAAVERCDVAIPGTAVASRLTISAGVARRQLASDADAHQLLRDADAALYRAKSDGRNCTRV